MMNRLQRRPLFMFGLLFLALLVTACGGGAGGGGSSPPATYTAAGTVTDADEKGIRGVTIDFGNAAEAEKTNGDGLWSRSGLTGTVTVTPSHDDYTFDPESLTVTGAATNVNFTGTAKSGGGNEGGNENGNGSKLAVVVTVHPDTVFVGDEVELTATVSGDDEHAADVTWAVTPDEGTFSSTEDLQVTWTAPADEADAGEYTITATVALDGRTASDSETVTVDVPGACPQGIECIYTLEDLQNMKTDVSAHYLLMNDIDASPTSSGSGGWDHNGFEPVGTSTDPFVGTFDGQNHVIDGLRINRNEGDLGLFGNVGAGAEIANVRLENVSVNGRSKQFGGGAGAVGALVGRNDGGTISAVRVEGEVKSARNVTGGLIGRSVDGVIRAAESTVEVTGKSYVGGLVGEVRGGTIEDSETSGPVHASGEKIGGLVGFFSGDDGEIVNSSSSSNVTGDAEDSEYVGGFIGEMQRATVENSHATGDVAGREEVGGLIGRTADGSVQGASAEGKVQGRRFVGGLIGRIAWDTSVDNSSSSGDVTASGEGSGEPGHYVGGLVGANGSPFGHESSHHGGPIANSSSTSTVEGFRHVGGLVGTHRNRGSIEDSWTDGRVDASGSSVGGLVGSAYARATISHSHSEGTVEGLGGTGGLVGNAMQTVVIEDSWSGADVTGTQAVGGLVGGLGGTTTGVYATVTRSSSSGLVEGDKHIGGLVGRARSGARIEQSFSTSEVEGNEGVGGLVGLGAFSDSLPNYAGTIDNSYALGEVRGGDRVGGLVGVWGESGAFEASGFITDSYSAINVQVTDSSAEEYGGLVGYARSLDNIEGAYYLDQLSTSDAGKARSDDALKQAGTYSGWDFDSTWEIDEPGEDYPQLRDNRRD